MNRISMFTLVAAVAATACVANAASYVVGPTDLAAYKTQFVPHNGSGNNPFGFYFDSVAPSYAAGAPAGYGNNSMFADVVNGNGGANPESRYQTFRVSPAYLSGGTGLTVAGLSGFSWQNLQLSGTNTWRISIYTEPTDVLSDPNDSSTGAGDASKWYGSRIQTNPASTTTGTLNVWQTLDSASLMFTNNGPSSVTGTWAQIQGAIGSQKIMFIDFTLGADNGGGTESAQLDAINFSYATGASDSINLEAVPLPSAAGMGLGLVSLMGLARRRKA